MSAISRTVKTLLFNTAIPSVAAANTALAAAITSISQTSITLSAPTSQPNGTYIQIGSERLLVVSGSGTANLTVTRGAWGTTAATYSTGATVNLPGHNISTLPHIATVPNQAYIGYKTTADINFVAVICAGSDTFPGGGTSIILADNLAPLGTLHIQAPGSGSAWIQLGGAGAAGPAGSGSTPAALNLTSNLGPAQVGAAYSGSLIASGGVYPYTYSIPSGLPPGLSLNAGTGAITGTPTTAGNYTFSATVTDTASTTATISCTITVVLGNLPPEQPYSVVLTELGPRTVQADRSINTILQATIQEAVSPSVGYTLGDKLHLQISSDGANWGDLGTTPPDRVDTDPSGTYYVTRIVIKGVLVYAQAQNWWVRSWAATDSFEPWSSAAVESAPYSLAGPGLPSANDIAAVTFGGYYVETDPAGWPYNVTDADNGRQWWDIPGITYDDTPASNDINAFFIRVTVQYLDSTHAVLGPELPYDGTEIVGGVYVCQDAIGGYGAPTVTGYPTTNIAYVRFRLYSCNIIDQTSQSFANPLCAVLQTGYSVSPTIGGQITVGSGYVDVLVASGGALPTGKVRFDRGDPNTLGPMMTVDSSNKPTIKISGPLYKDVSGALNLGISSDLSTAGGIVSITGVNLSNTYSVMSISKLAAGTCLVTGTATFAYTATGSYVQIGGAGAVFGDNFTSPQNTVTIDSTGITIQKVGAGAVGITNAGVEIDTVAGNQTHPFVTIAGGSGMIVSLGLGSNVFAQINGVSMGIYYGSIGSPTLWGQIYVGNTGASLGLTNNSGGSLTLNPFFYPTASSGSAILPAAPAGFYEILVGGVAKRVPYYNV